MILPFIYVKNNNLSIFSKISKLVSTNSLPKIKTMILGLLTA